MKTFLSSNFGLALALTLTAAGVTTLASAQPPLFWHTWTPSPSFPVIVNPPSGYHLVGGWWNSPDYGRTDIRICRLSDNLGGWRYGGFHSGACNIYSPSLRRGHVVSIGFDLLGGYDDLRWTTPGANHRRRWHRPTPLEARTAEGQPLQTPGQTSNAQQQEIESICRIVQANGAFIGTLQEETCYAAWEGLELISADYEIVELGER